MFDFRVIPLDLITYDIAMSKVKPQVFSHVLHSLSNILLQHPTYRQGMMMSSQNDQACTQVRFLLESEKKFKCVDTCVLASQYDRYQNTCSKFHTDVQKV